MGGSGGLGRERFEAQPLAVCGDVAITPRSLRNHDIGSCYDVLGAVPATTPHSQPVPLVAIVVELDQRYRFAGVAPPAATGCYAYLSLNRSAHLF